MHKIHLRLLLAASLALLLAACGGGGGGGGDPLLPPASGGVVEQSFSVRTVEARETGPIEPAPTYPLGARIPPAEITLPIPAETAPSLLAGTPGAPLKIGMARALIATSTPAGMARMLSWQTIAGGRKAAAIRFVSEGAAAIRLGMLVRRLPAAALVRLYVHDQATAFQITGDTITTALQRNREAGDVGDAGRTYWLPMVDSHDVTIELELPAGEPGDGVEFLMPTLSHMWAKSSELDQLKIGEASSCNVDVNCVSGSDSMSRSTARMVFSEGGSSYLCTGTLLNNLSNDGTPYFLSAAHCIVNQAAASSLTTYWFYRSTSCNSGVASSTFRVLPSGATLLYANTYTDTSFMRLNAPPPAGAVYAAWTGLPALGTSVSGVHHPGGDLQKFSQGTLVDYEQCSEPDQAGSFRCNSAPADSANNLSVRWSSGTTQGGSSGSGLFVTNGGTRYLVGQLRGGSHSCSFRSGTDSYGRFDIAYAAALGRWLGATTPAVPRAPVYRFTNTQTQATLFTANQQERDLILARAPNFAYNGVAFHAYLSQVAQSEPVHRYRVALGSCCYHFYTISQQERATIDNHAPNFTSEGVVWFAQSVAGGTAIPVYRFHRPSTGHTYALGEDEKNARLADPSFRFEGVAFWAWPTP